MNANPSPTVGPTKVGTGAYTAKLKIGNCDVQFQFSSPTLVGDEAASAPTKIRRLHLSTGLIVISASYRTKDKSSKNVPGIFCLFVRSFVRSFVRTFIFPSPPTPTPSRLKNFGRFSSPRSPHTAPCVLEAFWTFLKRLS